MQHVVLLLFCVLLSIPAIARQIDVVVGWDKPPYVMAETHSGFELELARQILAELGHDILPIYVPFGRTPRLINARGADIGLTMNARHPVDNAILSNVYVVYQNVAVTLKKRHLVIREVSDLRHHSVAAFQTASHVLGEAYREVVSQHPGYIEIPQQRRQVSLLLAGSIDVAVMDRNIFTHLRSKQPAERQAEVDIHTLFGVSPYRAAIIDDELRRQFNQTLATFIEDGRYQALIDQFGLVNLLKEIPVSRSSEHP
ncbi:substrate-binding periplasmic protein [Alteromonas sp. H39]|uniref:substrate-binding periplasmic protein n=1 Tax=Alteromonas sp. H39 TaxID=3389876 RepID=UPI0039E07135